MIVEAQLYDKHSWFRVKAGNGQIVLVSETYKRKASCRKMAKKIFWNLKFAVYKEIVG